MIEAELLFNDTFKRTMNSWGIILSFRTVTQAGMDAASSRTAQQMQRSMRELVGRGEALFTDVRAFLESGAADRTVEMAVAKTLTEAVNGIDGACILFAHSVLDAAAFDYCRVSSLVTPRDWESSVEKRKVELADARDLTFDELLKNKLNEFFEQLERESLLKKVDLLYSKCQPPPGWVVVENYTFDLSRLETLDKLRQEIVHRDGLGKAIPNADQEIEYMMSTSWHLMGLVNYKYNLKIDPTYYFQSSR